MNPAASASPSRPGHGPAWAGVLALAVTAVAVWAAWFQREATPPGELLVEVLPEEILEVAPPDWEALAAEMEARREADTVEEDLTPAETELENETSSEEAAP